MNDLDTIRRALNYAAEERLIDLCNAFGWPLSTAEKFRDDCAELRARIDQEGGVSA